VAKKIDLLGIGSFCDENDLRGGLKRGGQSIRTIQVFSLLEKNFNYSSAVVSYENWRKNPFRVFVTFLKSIKKAKRVIIFPASNAVRILLPISIFFKNVFKYKLYYVLIGGSITELIKENKKYKKWLNRIDGTFVQTKTMVSKLEEANVRNVFLLPNFKVYDEVKNQTLAVNSFKFIFFSRVVKGKGIEEAANAFNYFYEKGHKFSIDIYGPIADEYSNKFSSLLKKYRKFLSYKGEVGSKEAPNIISSYFMQIFPTKYYTEGFPGSILDSFYAGVPILASRWESADSVIENLKTGLIYNFDDYSDMREKIEFIFNNPEIINNMRKKCLKEAKKYNPSKIINGMYKIIE
jgi:glycosyltransferase involved in cell wall biosynthesis